MLLILLMLWMSKLVLLFCLPATKHQAYNIQLLIDVVFYYWFIYGDVSWGAPIMDCVLYVRLSVCQISTVVKLVTLSFCPVSPQIRHIEKNKN